MEIGGQILQIIGQLVRGQLPCRIGQQGRKARHARHQRIFCWRDQPVDGSLCSSRQRSRLIGIGQDTTGLRQNGADPGVGVLDVIDGVLVGTRQGQVHIEGELGIALARDEEEAHGIAPANLVPAARPFDQVTQRDVAAGPLGYLDLLAAAHDAHHLVQHVIGVALRNAGIQRLQAGAHPRHRAVVV